MATSGNRIGQVYQIPKFRGRLSIEQQIDTRGGVGETDGRVIFYALRMH